MAARCIIRERFSAREFWDDIVRNDCTMMQYIGELCRYLVNSPPHPNETKHRLRLACGNGLRPDIWEEFKTRFRIPLILEFYAATEGNVMMFNFEGKTAAIGRLPWYLEHRFPTALVRFDVEKEQPMRDNDGFCMVCAPNEVGEAIGKIINDPEPAGGTLRGLCAQGGRRKEDPARRVRERRRLVPHRRPDAQGRARLFLFRRPHRRHLPLEGRECLDLGSCRER